MNTIKSVANPYGDKVIVVDWGTTSLRCMLIAGEGKILAETGSEGGIQFIKNKRFESELMAAIGGWLEENGPIPVLALGMITSKSGWVEVPYVPCPATAESLANGMIRASLSNGSDLFFLSGITDKTRFPFPDVMRGEETQILGFGLEEELTIVLPGTHSKWARVGGGEISKFQTFVTGEVFALFAQHSFIAKAAGQDSRDDNWDAMLHGARIAKAAAVHDAAFLTQLMSIRTGMLAGELTADQMLSYLSGLIIGSEFRQAMEAGWFKPGDTIGIIGNDGLNDRYRRVSEIFELHIKDGGAQAAVVGALQIFAGSSTNAA